MDEMKLLRSSELFQSLLDDDLVYLLTKTEHKQVTAGQYIFRTREPAVNFFIIESGEIVISQEDEEGTVHDLARFIKGDSFGEFDFVSNATRDAAARAVQPCGLLVFPAADCTIEEMALEKPGTISRLYLQFMVTLSRRLRSIHSLISENSVWVRQLQDSVFIDQHTGLYTRPFLDTEIPKALKLPASLIIIKPDRFKEINDSYGHKAGDAVLHRIATNLLQIVETRKDCWAVRIRGNEMALILNHSSREEADRLTRKIAGIVSNIGPGRLARPGAGGTPEAATNSDAFRLTVSSALGIYENRFQDWQTFFDAVYQQVKKAWSDGGNRLISLKLSNEAT